MMGESNCVQCGECMTSCPTGALSLRRRVQPRAWDDSPTQIPVNPNTPFPADSGFLTADEIQQVWLRYDSPTRGDPGRVPVPGGAVCVPEVERGCGAEVGDPARRKASCSATKGSTAPPRSCCRARARSRSTPRLAGRPRSRASSRGCSVRQGEDGFGLRSARAHRDRRRTRARRNGLPHAPAANRDHGCCRRA